MSIFEFDIVTINVEKTGFLGRGKPKITTSSKRGTAEYRTEELGNDVSLDMVSIPGGNYLMSSAKTEVSRNGDERPKRDLAIQPFYMSRYLVTQLQWQTVMDNNPSYFRGANRPVEQVSLKKVLEFCSRLSEKTGREYRLPYESEWEYACRAGTTTPFHFGGTITPELANYDGNKSYNSGPKGKYRQETTDVGNFPPNAFGLYDMHGNLWEWCQKDPWNSDDSSPAKVKCKRTQDFSSMPIYWLLLREYYYLTGLLLFYKSLFPSVYGQCSSHVLRGGPWNAHPRFCRSDSRLDIHLINWSCYIGFRIVCAGDSHLTHQS